WDECLDDIGARLEAVRQQTGPDAVGFFFGNGAFVDSAGQRIADSLVGALGTRSKYSDWTIDGICKPVVAEAVAGSLLMFPIVDPDCPLLLLIGCNPVVSHGHTASVANPVVFLRTMASNGALWVLDPRRTESARLATRHLAPRPGMDHIVLAHAIRELLRDGADHEYLAERVSGVEELRRAVEPFDAGVAAELSGIEIEALAELVAAIRRAGRVGFITGTGVAMAPSGPVTEWLAWALALVTGSLDRPGGMWFNPGFLTQLDRRTWRTKPWSAPKAGPASWPELPANFGELPAIAIPGEIEAGNLRALIVLGGNLVGCLPDTARVTEALSRLDLLVVSDIVSGPTTALATHVLPTADQLERADLPAGIDLTMTGLYSQYTPAVVPLAGERRPMWWLLAQIGRRLGHQVLPGGIDPDVATDDDVLAHLARRARTSFEELRAHDGALHGEPAEFGWVTAVLRDGRFDAAPAVLVERLAALASVEAPESLVLVPRRQVRHMNSVHYRAGETPEVLVHPADAARAGVIDGARVVGSSTTGSLTAVARLDPDLRAGVVSVAHGWEGANVNHLISSRDDVEPLTGMPRSSGTVVVLAAEAAN
ncbi:MAG: putative dehydrogenase, partial [Acidimicrobiia bacterium]|nr:putative dehydrogenase [Acidimicrobiia bacterium]